MARPTRIAILNGNQGWDGSLETNLQNVFDRPFPTDEHSGDESDLESTFPAASYDRCSIWVNHSTLGWSLYVSDGTAWVRMQRAASPAIVDIPGASTDAENKINELLGILRDHGIVS